MAKKDASRIEQSYEDAVRAHVDKVKTDYYDLSETAEILIRIVAARVEWKQQENEIKREEAATKGVPQPQPISNAEEIEELERLGRIMSTLHDPRLSIYRTGDPDAGVKEICRILEIARKEYGDANEEPTEGANDKEIPDGMDKEEGEGDESRKNPTPERHYVASTDSHRRNSKRGRG